MNVRRLRSLLATTLALLPGVVATAQGDEAARLVPADATILIAVESPRALDALLQAYAALGEEGEPAPTFQGYVDGMASPEAQADPAGLAVLDPDRPAYLAFALTPAGPTTTVVATVANGRPLRFDPGAFGELHTEVRLGNTVGLSSDSTYVVTEAPSPLVARLAPGILSAHIDLGALIEQFRPLIVTGLRQAEMAIDGIPRTGSFDPRPLMEVYLDTAYDLLDRAAGLDLSLTHAAGRSALSIVFEQRTEFAAQPTAGVGGLLGLLPGDGSIELLSNGKATSYLEQFEDFIDAAVEIYPEPLRRDLQRVLEAQERMEELLAPGLAMSVSLTPSGMRGAYAMRSADPAALMALLEELLRGFDHDQGVLSLGPARSLPVAGLEARSYSLEMDYGALMGVMAAGMEEEELSAEVREQATQTLESLYGKSLEVGLAARGETVLMAFGGSDAELVETLGALNAARTPGHELQRLAACLEPSRLGWVYRVDFGGLVGTLFQRMTALMPQMQALPELHASMDVWVSTGGRTWSSGIAMDATDVVSFVRQMRTLEER